MANMKVQVPLKDADAQIRKTVKETLQYSVSTVHSISWIHTLMCCSMHHSPLFQCKGHGTAASLPSPAVECYPPLWRSYYYHVLQHSLCVCFLQSASTCHQLLPLLLWWVPQEEALQGKREEEGEGGCGNEELTLGYWHH